jgi:ABC-2 type transport system ATP-binding protein
LSACSAASVPTKDSRFQIKKGEFFGIVGRNGSGKSTLLKLLAGIYEPDKGRLQINGRLTPFIELGVGFNPELTGRENVYLNGALLGFNRKEISTMYNQIVQFAELEKFMDQKLKNYSSGMQVRLAFSIAIRAKSDILLIDEVLAVGDAAFQTKCFDYFMELKKTGTTVVFVSHDRASLERFCDRGVLINQGELLTAGDIRKVMKDYSNIVLEEIGKEVPSDVTVRSQKRRSPYVNIQNVKTFGDDGRARTKFTHGSQIDLRFEVKVLQAIKNPILGVTVWQKNVEKPIFAVNTQMEGKPTGTYAANDIISFSTLLPIALNDGEYFVEPAIANESATLFFDQIPKAARFFISGSQNPYSLMSAEQPIKLEKT